MRETGLRAFSGTALFLLVACSGNDKILNPAHIDSDVGPQGTGASPKNADLYAGTLDSSTKTAIQSASFFPSWKLAAESRNLTTGASTARAMLLSGIALSDRNCVDWFQRLAETQANIAFNRDLLSSTGGLAAAIMGLTRTAAPAIAGLAAATAFGEQIIDSTSANFIVAPDIGLVQDLVTRLRADQAMVLSDQVTFEYGKVLVWLVAYDNTCSHSKVKQLVNQSVANSTKDATSTDLRWAKYNYTVATIRVYFVKDAIIGPDEIIWLYGLLLGSSEPKISDAVRSKFLSFLIKSKVVTSDSTLKAFKLNLSSDYTTERGRLYATASIQALLAATLPRPSVDAAVSKTEQTPVNAATEKSPSGLGTATDAAASPPAAAAISLPPLYMAPLGSQGGLQQRTLTLPSIQR